MSNKRKLVIEVIIYLKRLIVTNFRWICVKSCKSSNGSSASFIVMFLIFTLKFSNFSIWCNTNMRGEKNEKISIFRNMWLESFKSNFTNKRNTSQASHIETFTPKVFQLTVETMFMMVDFIDTYTAREQSIKTIHSLS